MSGGTRNITEGEYADYELPPPRVFEAARDMLQVLDGYSGQLVPVSGLTAVVSALRAAVAVEAQRRGEVELRVSHTGRAINVN